MSRANTDQAMREYLSALLTEERDTITQPLRHEPVARLLEQVKPEPLVEAEIKSVQEEPVVGRIEARTEPMAKAPPEPEVVPEPEPEPAPVADAQIIADVEAHKGNAGQPPDTSMEEYQQQEFQALFFKVAGLTLAVPLKSLGGIHSMGKTSTLFGKPDWFVGIMTERENKLQVVDTARWVMPEKYTDKLASELDYQYLIMLSGSSWGLACEELVTSTTVQPDAIQWRRTDQGKRPWLAGVVRDKMCALLNVDALIAMLDKGMGSQQG